MDIGATSASTAATSTTTSPTPTTTAADAAQKTFATLFAEAKDDAKKGEKLTQVDGHPFARIKGGTRDDMCINLSGNERSGQAFDLIWRDGRQFHVYGGKGADHKVVEVGRKAADTTSADATPTTDSSGGTTSTSSTPATTTPSTSSSTTSSSATS